MYSDAFLFGMELYFEPVNDLVVFYLKLMFNHVILYLKIDI